ncbi:KPN_02809 family neutral zinc metallopeptidase [Rubritalea sp.]|uniref:KPN_02809 family neutral zinc metallopeptidase n=1 Tax=Rubritalea sp. TaxID=2109375 RepID=UPI003EF3791D
MQWKGRRQSTNVQDRRGERVSKAGSNPAVSSAIMGLFFRSSGKTKLVLVLLAIFGFTFCRGPMLEILGFNSTPANSSYVANSSDKEMKAYLSTMVADNETVWGEILPEYNLSFRPAQMTIYSQRVNMPGGYADARMGPFYLPANETIYIDPSFFTEMKEKFGATGDFAEAYVVAHEYGHHIQHIMGRLKELHSSREKVSQRDFNRHSVRVELQADFLAGVFAHHADETFKKFLDTGDIEEAMRCAEAIGDDRLQQQSQGKVVRDSFTHGTSKQRAYWFNKGYTSGDLREGEALYSLPYDQL